MFRLRLSIYYATEYNLLPRSCEGCQAYYRSKLLIKSCFKVDFRILVACLIQMWKQCLTIIEAVQRNDIGTSWTLLKEAVWCSDLHQQMAPTLGQNQSREQWRLCKWQTDAESRATLEFTEFHLQPSTYAWQGIISTFMLPWKTALSLICAVPVGQTSF